MKKFILPAAASMLLLAACNSGSSDQQAATAEQPKWTLKGTAAGAEGKMAYVEAADNGRWNCIDSVKIGDNGEFSISTHGNNYPDIYRLSVDRHAIYFPIDSTETVTVAADFTRPGDNYVLSGSNTAELVQKINDRIAQEVALVGEEAAVNNEQLKRDIAGYIGTEWGSMAAYYAVNRTVGKYQLFDPSRPFDLKIINAVANYFDQNAPDDPRAAMLRNIALNNRLINSAFVVDGDKVQAYEFPDIVLRDKENNPRSLREEWLKGNVMVLTFTYSGIPDASNYNLYIQRIYDKYKDKGVEIYQVDCTNDEYTWLNSARNIPWISVYNDPASAAKVLQSYNVYDLPTTFVINRDGDDMRRIETLKELDETVASFL